jgi:hypothetical protein
MTKRFACSNCYQFFVTKNDGKYRCYSCNESFESICEKFHWHSPVVKVASFYAEYNLLTDDVDFDRTLYKYAENIFNLSEEIQKDLISRYESWNAKCREADLMGKDLFNQLSKNVNFDV